MVDALASFFGPGVRVLGVQTGDFMLKGKKLAVIGVGKLGEALVLGLLNQGSLKKEDILGTV